MHTPSAPAPPLLLSRDSLLNLRTLANCLAEDARFMTDVSMNVKHSLAVGAPKRARSVPTHSGLRHNCANAPIRLILLSRILKEKSEDTLAIVAAMRIGTVLLSGLVTVMLKVCRYLHAGGPDASILTEANVKTLFSISGSTLARDSMYAANLTLPSRLPVGEARQAFDRMLVAVGSVWSTESGAKLTKLVNVEMHGAPQPADAAIADAFARSVVEEIQQSIDIGACVDSDILSILADGEDADAADDESSRSIDTQSTRSTRGANPLPPEPQQPLRPALPSVIRDSTNRIVYVDARGSGNSAPLRSALLQAAPDDSTLAGLDTVNKGRALIDIKSAAAMTAFQQWLCTSVADNAAVAEMISSVADESGSVLLLGAHFIIPKVTSHDHMAVQEQAFHTDIEPMGQVVAVAVNTEDREMDTLIDAQGTVLVRSPTVGRAATSLYCFDIGVVHAGPGRQCVHGPYPVYDKTRVFFLLASPTMPMELVTVRRKDNGLKRMPLLLKLRPSAPNPTETALDTTASLAEQMLRRIEVRIGRDATAVEENTLLRSLMEAIAPLPSGSAEENTRLGLLLGPVLNGLCDPACAQLHASLCEVLRVSEAQPTPTFAHLCERLVATTGAVAALGSDFFI